MSRTMAMGLRNPENLLAMGKFHKHTTSPVHVQCIKHSPSISVRHFTSSRRHQAVIQQMKPQGMMPAQKARKTQMNAMSVKGMGTDLGRLPGVVILPSWRDHPRSASKLLKLYWEKFKQTSVAMYALIQIYKWDVPKNPRTGKRITRPLHMTGRESLAMVLHRNLNQAIAMRSARWLNDLCCSGLYAKCRARIDLDRAQQKEQVEWEIVEYTGIKWPTFMRKWPLTFFLVGAPVRVVSDKITLIPIKKASYLREIIVRIRTVQVLKTASQPNPERKTLEEHIVLQQLTLDGETQGWKVWGTIDPSKKELDEILSGNNKNNSLNLSQTFKQRIASITGMPL